MATPVPASIAPDADKAGQRRDAFVQAMRRLAATVTLVTAGTEDEPVGMAATAVSSITADPPMLMVAVNRNSRMFPTVVTSRQFCVNLLAAHHAPLVAVFGGKVRGRDRFLHGDWIHRPGAPPILADAAASLVCAMVDELDVGTHRLLIGEVQSLRCAEGVDPLLWVDGGLAQAVRLLP